MILLLNDYWLDVNNDDIDSISSYKKYNKNTVFSIVCYNKRDYYFIILKNNNEIYRELLPALVDINDRTIKNIEIKLKNY